jgi:hypothetical protein
VGDARRLRQLPHQRVFAPARTDDQYIHVGGLKQEAEPLARRSFRKTYGRVRLRRTLTCPQAIERLRIENCKLKIFNPRSIRIGPKALRPPRNKSLNRR